MLIDKNELDSRIYNILTATRKRKQEHKQMMLSLEDYFSEKNVPIANVAKITEKNLPLDSFTGSSYIYMTFVIGLHDVLSKDKVLSKNNDFRHLAAHITPEKCFTEIELESYNESTFTSEDKDYSTISFEGFSRVDDDQYIGVLSLAYLVELFDNGRLEYNEKTQRPFKTKVLKNGKDYEVVSKIDINQKSVNEIAERILDGTYIYDTITINVQPKSDGTVDIQDGVIKTYNCEFHVNDGFHRCVASARAYMKNPYIEKNWEIRLVFFNEQKANRLIVQFDKRNPIGKDVIAMKDDSNLATGIVKDLNSISRLKGCIGIAGNLTPQQIIKFSTLAQAIDEVFNLRTTYDLVQNKQFIIDGFNFLVDSGIIQLNQPLRQSKLLLCLILLKKYKDNVDCMYMVSNEFQANSQRFEEVYRMKDTKSLSATVKEIYAILGGAN